MAATQQFLGNLHMFETFATIIALLYFVGYTVFISALIYQFSKLSSYAQQKANIHLSFSGILMYLASIAWLIAKVIS